MKQSVLLVGFLVLAIVLTLVARNSIQSLGDQLQAKDEAISVLEDELAVRQTEIFLRDEQIANLKDDLNALLIETREINASKLALEEDKSYLESQLFGIRSEIERTADELKDYETEITESMAWFRTNSNLDNFKEWNLMKSFINGWCAEKDDDVCKIRLSCLTFVTNYQNGFSYQYDKATTGKSDYLLDLGQIYNNKGGDCEDYSLFAVAALNYIQDECSRRTESIEYIAFTKSEGDRHFVEETKKYYIPDAKDFDIPSEMQSYHIVCGTFPVQYDPNSAGEGLKVGHCVLGFSEERVESSSDVTRFLNKAILIEPQTGAYLTDLREPTLFHIPKDGESKREYPLTLVITDEDLYMYSEYKGKMRWHGYYDYVDEIDSLENSITELMKG